MAIHSPTSKFMRAAIEDAKQHLGDVGGGPFGACIVKGDTIIAISHNTVLEQNDPTCHAEVNAIRRACQHLKTYDLSGCTIYSTTEPCPMCFSAIHWARIEHIVFGTRIADVQALGFNELELSNEQMRTMGKSPITITGDFLREECLDLLRAWQNTTGVVTY